MEPYRRVGPSTFVAWGATAGELFENAASAAFSLVADPATLAPTYSHPLVAPGDTVDELLVAWLDELIAVSAAVDIVPCYFVVDRLEEGGVQGSFAGLPGREVRVADRLIGLAVRPSVVEVPEGFWTEVGFAVEPL